MSTVIIFAGIPGSGKSTVLNETVKLFPQLTIVNYGNLMLEEASCQKIDKDALRKLPLFEQQKIGVEAARKIAANMPKTVCIDTHAMIKTPIGFCPGIPEEVLRILNPNVIAMIDCLPSHVYERRQLDKTRNRDDETVEDIAYHQKISRSFLITCSVLSGALFAPIDNHNSPGQAAKEFVKLLNSF